MYKINIKVSSDRRIDMSSHSGGVTGEKNTASLVFEIPKEYSSYNKYLDIFKESGEKLQTVVSVKDESAFSYILPGELCDNLNVYMQLVMKKGDAVFKSYRFVIAFEEGINVTSYLEDNCRDSIQELFEIKADKDEVSELSKALLDKLSAQVFYNEKQILENIISGKADTDFVDERLNLKADKAEAYEKLSLKADKSEMLESLELKADKTDVSAKLILKADKETVETELLKKLNITDAESALSLKVDKEAGKGLSSNDFTDEEKEKLLTIADTYATKEEASKFTIEISMTGDKITNSSAKFEEIYEAYNQGKRIEFLVRDSATATTVDVGSILAVNEEFIAFKLRISNEHELFICNSNNTWGYGKLVMERSDYKMGYIDDTVAFDDKYYPTCNAVIDYVSSKISTAIGKALEGDY